MPDKESVNKNVLAVEVISPFVAKMGAFIDQYMPNPDEILDETGQQIEIYRKMKTDARISSLLEIRKAEILDYPYYLLPADTSPRAQQIADDVQKTLEGLNLYSELKEMLSALDYGFSISEVVWELSGIRWDLKALKSRKPDRFQFKADGTPVLVERGVKKPLDDPYKYIVHRHNSEAENPYGNAVLKACYWPWMFKKAGWRFWLTATEKFGVPTVLALFDTDDEEKARERAKMLGEMLSGIQSDAAVALANVKEVTTLEVKGDLSEFHELIQACDTQMAYAITGQSLATNEAKYGTKAQGEVQDKKSKMITSGDARQLAWTLNETLISWIVILNYGPDAPVPRLEFDIDDYASWEIIKDALDMGLPVSRQALYTKYRIPKPVDDADAFIAVKAQSEKIEMSDPGKKKALTSSLPTRPYLRISGRKL